VKNKSVTMSKIVPTEQCITDCSILNQTTCLPAAPKPRNIVNYHLDYDGLWEEDGCYNTSLYQKTEYYHTYQQFSTAMSVTMIVVAGLGLLGNTFSIFVLARREMRNCFNNILIALNVCDSLHLIFAIMDAVRNSFGELYPSHLLHIFPYIHYPFYRISLCASIFLIISVAIERYLAVCRPHHYREIQTDSSRCLRYILPSLIAAFVVNMSRFFETETASICLDFTECGPCYETATWAYYVRPTQLRLKKEYIIYYHTWTWVVFTGLIPLIILVFLNLRILSSLRSLRCRLEIGKTVTNGSSTTSEKLRERRATQQSRDCNLAIILISTVVMFFLCHLPRVVTSIYEAANIHSILDCREKGRDKTPIWFMYITNAVQLLMVVNASVNLPIFFFAGKTFREVTINLLRWLLPKAVFAGTPRQDNNLGGDAGYSAEMSNTQVTTIQTTSMDSRNQQMCPPHPDSTSPPSPTQLAIPKPMGIQ